MINTMFLTGQNDDLNKSFSRLHIPNLVDKRIPLKNKKEIHSDIVLNRRFENFSSKEKVYLEKTNQIFCLDYVKGNPDIVLPLPDRMFDWIVLWYDQDRTIYNVSFEQHSALKIYGNGKRIMGFDEPLVCDMPFMSLRLTYVNDIDGWIVT